MRRLRWRDHNTKAKKNAHAHAHASLESRSRTHRLKTEQPLSVASSLTSTHKARTCFHISRCPTAPRLIKSEIYATLSCALNRAPNHSTRNGETQHLK